MTKRLTCPSGHAWDWGGTGTVPICPACGAAAVFEPVDAAAPTFVPESPAADAALTLFFPDAERLAGQPTLGDVPHRDEESALKIDVPGYAVLDVLGRGGMGVVYRARHEQLGRVVALKMILAGGHASGAELERFRAEGQAIARLQHGNIVQIHEVGEHQGLPYYSLEYCAGGSLEKKLAGTPLPPGEAAALLEVLARAMHVAHQKGLLHRDLKPANVLLTEDGTPKVTDFGLARQIGAAGMTATGAVLGTPSYMAPEQASGKVKELGPACDVYALGAILYECLTGRPPFKAAMPLDTVLQVIGEEPVPPRQLNAGVPRDLETVCLKCLQKEPVRRYASAEALADDLRRFQAGEPILARPVGRLERSVKWVRRNPQVATLLGTVFVLLVLGSGMAWGLAAWALGEADNARAETLRADGAAKLADLAAIDAGDEARKAKLLKGWADLKAELARQRLEDLKVEQKRTRQQLALSRANLFTAQLTRVAAVYERQPGLALELLHDYDACPIDLRDAAWRFDERAATRWLLTSLRGHTGVVFATAFSPDGQTLASAGADRAVRLWNLATGKQRQVLPGHTDTVLTLAFSPDGRTLASAGRDRTVRLWQLPGGKECMVLAGHADSVLAVAFSQDGQMLASSSDDQTIRLWDLPAGQFRSALRGHSEGVFAVAFSPDSRLLASVSADKTVRLWELPGGGARATLEGHTDWVQSVAFSPDGKTLASASRDKTVRLWDLPAGQPRTVLAGHSAGVWSIAFSPDGLALASAGDDQMVRVWDLHASQERVVLRGHTDFVQSVAFSPDGKTLASAGGDQTVRLWDLTHGPERAVFPAHAGGADAVAFSPDKTTLASAGVDGIVPLWDLATGHQRMALKGHTGPVFAAAFSPDGATLASAGKDGTVRVWDPQGVRPNVVLSRNAEAMRALAFSADGNMLASAGDDRKVRLWELPGGRLRATLPGHTRAIVSLAFHPDGKLLASSSEDQSIRLWDVDNGQVRATLEGHTDFVRAVAFHPNGKTLASAGKDGTVRLWDVDSGQTRAIFKRLSEGVRSLAFTADGQSLASAGDDRLVRIWDVETGQERALLKGHTQAVHAVAFTGDIGALASAGADGTVRLWDLARGPERAAFKWHADVVRAVAFSPDGKTLASASDDKTVRLWDVDTGQERAVLKGHARPVSFVAFSANGKQLLTKDLGNIASVWDAATGHLLADAPLPEVAPPAAVSPDGRWQAHIDRNIVRLLDRHWTKPLLPPRPRPATPDPAWHAEQAVHAEKDKQFFAAGFHFGKLADAQPWNAQARWHEALAWAQAQQHARATLAFVRAVLLDPRIAVR